MSARRLFAVAALSLAMVSAAGAAQDFDARTEIVRFDDLNIASAAGLARLDTRLKTAARRVCDSGSRTPADLQRDNACRKHALDGARTQVAALTKSGGTVVALLPEKD